MSFQKCPICTGNGYVMSDLTSNHLTNKCPVCHGHKIISALTGLPPNN